MENQFEVILNEDVLSCPAVKPKKPRSEKQLENDKKTRTKIERKEFIKETTTAATARRTTRY